MTHIDPRVVLLIWGTYLVCAVLTYRHCVDMARRFFESDDDLSDETRIACELYGTEPVARFVASVLALFWPAFIAAVLAEFWRERGRIRRRRISLRGWRLRRLDDETLSRVHRFYPPRLP